MWPKNTPWQSLRFGVEVEFVGVPKDTVRLPSGWTRAEEHLWGEDGRESGGEVQSPPITWADRAQITTVLATLRAMGARANWSCGLHVHIGLDPWGEAIVDPLVDAALASQHALSALLQTAPHRLLYCPPVTEAMQQAHLTEPRAAALRHTGRPQSHRCGINIAAWYDTQTVEIRYANGSLRSAEVLRAVELCLRWVAAVGENGTLSGNADDLARMLSCPVTGYPPPQPAPLWHQERLWLEDALSPVLLPLAWKLAPGSEMHHILPVSEGILVALEAPGADSLTEITLRWSKSEWQVIAVNNPSGSYSGDAN